MRPSIIRFVALATICVALTFVLTAPAPPAHHTSVSHAKTRSPRMARAAGPKRHAHWHYARVLVTAYVIRNNQDLPHYHCKVYNAPTSNGDTVHVGSIAVDPHIFPYGTRFRIPGIGRGRADDTGGYINGHHIDVAMTSCREAIQWGAQHVVVAYAAPHT